MLPKRPLKRLLKKPREKIKKTKENNGHTKKEVLQLPELMSKIPLGRETKILKVIFVSAIIKKDIMPTNIRI